MGTPDPLYSALINALKLRTQQQLTRKELLTAVSDNLERALTPLEVGRVMYLIKSHGLVRRSAGHGVYVVL